MLGDFAGTVDGAKMGVAAWGMFGAVLGAAIGDVLMSWLGAVIGDWVGQEIGDAQRAEMRVAFGAVTRLAIEAVMLGQHRYAAWVQAQQTKKISFSCALQKHNLLNVSCIVCKQLCVGPRWRTVNTICQPAYR